MEEVKAPVKSGTKAPPTNGDESKAVVTAPVNTPVQTAKAVERFAAVDLNVEVNELPDLDQAKELPLNLISEYWTPETVGETRNMFFSHIADSDLIDEETGQVKTLRTAFFYQKQGGEMKTIRNASKRLVGAVESNDIKWGTPLRITYMGKKKNVNTAFKSDDWSVKPLLIEVK